MDYLALAKALVAELQVVPPNAAKAFAVAFGKNPSRDAVAGLSRRVPADKAALYCVLLATCKPGEEQGYLDEVKRAVARGSGVTLARLDALEKAYRAR